MGPIAFVLIFSIVATIFIIVFMLMSMSANTKSLKSQLNSLPDFTPTLSYISPTCKNAVAIDTENRKVAIICNILKFDSETDAPIIYNFAELLAVEVIRDDSSVMKVNRGSQLTGAAVGGLLLGPAGMLLGGLSGSKRSEQKVRRLSLKIYSSNIVEPVAEVFFLDNPAPGLDVASAETIIQDLDKWYARLSAVIAQQKDA